MKSLEKLVLKKTIIISSVLLYFCKKIKWWENVNLRKHISLKLVYYEINLYDNSNDTDHIELVNIRKIPFILILPREWGKENG